MPIFEQAFPIARTTSSASTRDTRRSAYDGNHEFDRDGDAASSANSSDAEPIVPRDFPVAPLKDGRKQTQPKPKPQRNLIHQHFAVLNAILHTSLMKADFARASRAFGLLLRCEINGKRANMRQRGLWGIGSEILLHRPVEIANNADAADAANTENIEDTADDASTSDIADSANDDIPPLPFTEQGLLEARQFFDRLMLEFPFRQANRHYLDEQHFLPVILNLEIYQLQARMARARYLKTRNQEDDDMAVEPNGDAIEQVLDQARAIAERIDDKLAFPPFDRDSTVLQLKGDLWSWMADQQGGSMSQWRAIARDAHGKARLYSSRNSNAAQAMRDGD